MLSDFKFLKSIERKIFLKFEILQKLRRLDGRSNAFGIKTCECWTGPLYSITIILSSVCYTLDLVLTLYNVHTKYVDIMYNVRRTSYVQKMYKFSAGLSLTITLRSIE